MRKPALCLAPALAAALLTGGYLWWSAPDEEFSSVEAFRAWAASAGYRTAPHARGAWITDDSDLDLGGVTMDTRGVVLVVPAVRGTDRLLDGPFKLAGKLALHGDAALVARLLAKQPLGRVVRPLRDDLFGEYGRVVEMAEGRWTDLGQNPGGARLRGDNLHLCLFASGDGLRAAFSGLELDHEGPVICLRGGPAMDQPKAVHCARTGRRLWP